MRLATLVAGLPVTGDLGTNPEVFGVRHDSRAVAPGDLFVTWSGARFDGRRFAQEAVARGAVAVVADRTRAPEVDPVIPWLVAEAPRALLGPLAAPLYRHPDRGLTLVGVTGTNGKSTTIELAAAMLDAAGRPAARLGTLGYRFRELAVPGVERTTPEASDLFRLLAEMRDAGAAAAAMEVSSHALVQGRVAGASFDVGAFTNLTRDHLDYHVDLESYFAAKRRLFDQLKPGGRAVVNGDDPFGQRLAADLPAALSYGAAGAVRALDAKLGGDGIVARLVTPRGETEVRSPLLGRFNLSNLLAAAAIGEALELPLAAIAEGIAGTQPLAGRMEAVRAGQGFLAVVDFAHTDDALSLAIRSLREIARTRIVLVFGCGGDRDPGKRPIMGRVAGDLADLPIATSDNSRSEDPHAILSAIEEGLRASGNRSYRIVPDRREAIRRAVAVAVGGGWSVLVAGKGHEREMVAGGQRLPFSDRDELERAIRERTDGEEGA